MAACLWGFFATSSDDVWTGYDAGLSWRQKARITSMSVTDLYGVSLYVALNNIFGGSCEIQVRAALPPLLWGGTITTR